MNLIYINNIAINPKAILANSFLCFKTQETEEWTDATGRTHYPVVRERYICQFIVPLQEVDESKVFVDELVAWIEAGRIGGEVELSSVWCAQENKYVTFVAKMPTLQIPVERSNESIPTYTGFSLQFVGV